MTGYADVPAVILPKPLICRRKGYFMETAGIEPAQRFLREAVGE